MKVQYVENSEEFNVAAADLVCAQIQQKADSLLVFPTGNTPLGMFAELAKRYSLGQVSFSNAYLAELDEYRGIALDDPRNLFAWLERVFIRRVDFRPERVFRFDSAAIDSKTEAARMEGIIQRLGGIDLLLLGLGPNGHIGFNEPGSERGSATRVVKLSEVSLASNAGYWGEALGVPEFGYTLGIETILNARQVVLLVQGAAKEAILEKAIHAPISENIPATFLRELEKYTIISCKS